MPTVNDTLRQGQQGLQTSDSPALDAEVLLSSVLGRSREQLLAHSDQVLTETQRQEWEALFSERLAQRPVAQLTGHQEFRGRRFRVTSDVLIPRPETEELVDRVLAESGQQIIDLGTGSGCIAISLALEGSGSVLATDLSNPALAVAQENARELGADVQFQYADLLTNLTLPPAPETVLVANLPYVRAEEYQASRALKYEPRLALAAGPDGLAVIWRLFDQLAAGQWWPQALWLEIAPVQGAAIAERFGKRVQLHPDLTGRTRFARVAPS